MNDTSMPVPSFDCPGEGAFHYDHFLGPRSLNLMPWKLQNALIRPRFLLHWRLLPVQAGLHAISGNV